MKSFIILLALLTMWSCSLIPTEPVKYNPCLNSDSNDLRCIDKP